MPVHAAKWNRPAWQRCAGVATVFSMFFSLAASFFPAATAAEGISGYLDLGYTNVETDVEDVFGKVTRSDTSAITQRYNLMFSKGLAPYLRFYANGLFNKADSATVTNGNRTESTSTLILPTVDLTLRSPVYTAGVKYSRAELTSTSNGLPSTTDINESYQGILGWKPPDPNLPSFEMRLTRTHSFDRERVSHDIVSDFAGLVMNYAPTSKVLLVYRPSYIDTTNKFSGLETQTLTQTGLVQYSDRFFRDRISIGTSYNVTYNDLRVSVSGTGSVDISQSAFSGLSSIDDTPVDGALAPNPALIDTNLTASAGINIGLPPLVGGDERERNIGLDFSFPKEVNTLLLWVDKPLPAAIANSFSWSIYTSTDNTTWSLLTTVFPAPFGTFENRFEITFSPVTTRYIKVVVKPLSLAVTGASGFPEIFVTELQAFSRKPAEQVRGKSTSSTHVISFDGRALLLEKNPNLYYELTYLLQRSEPSSQERWTLSNGLMAIHRFSKIFSGTARVAREDFSDPTEYGMAYLANTSLEAVPLPSLRHNLSYSGRFEETAGKKKTNTNNVFLDNTVQVYRGVVLLASGGLSFLDQDPEDRHQKSTNLSASANIQPHRTLGLNYQVTSTKTESSGEGKPEATTRTTANVASATYHPYETLYLVAGWTETSDQAKTNRLQNYGLNWSPFLGGSLQFAFTYSETMVSEGNAKSRIISPSMTWKVTRTASLTALYEAVRTTSDTGKTDSKTFSTNLRAYF